MTHFALPSVVIKEPFKLAGGKCTTEAVSWLAAIATEPPSTSNAAHLKIVAIAIAATFRFKYQAYNPVCSLQGCLHKFPSSLA